MPDTKRLKVIMCSHNLAAWVAASACIGRMHPCLRQLSMPKIHEIPLTDSTPSPLWTRVRNELRARRDAWAEYRQLERDLASYSTDADRSDLLGSTRDVDHPDAELTRSILMKSAGARQ